MPPGTRRSPRRRRRCCTDLAPCRSAPWPRPACPRPRAPPATTPTAAARTPAPPPPARAPAASVRIGQGLARLLLRLGGLRWPRHRRAPMLGARARLELDPHRVVGGRHDLRRAVLVAVEVEGQPRRH